MRKRASDNSAAPWHVLLIHQFFAGPGEAGGTRHFELAKNIVGRGHRFSVVASTRSYLSGERVSTGNDDAQSAAFEGVRIHRTPTFPLYHRNYFWRAISFISFLVTSVWTAWRVGSVDVVMGTSPPLPQAVSAWLVSRLRRKPFVLEVRDLWPDFAVEMGVLTNPVLIAFSRWLERFLYSQANHIVVNSPAYREHLQGLGVNEERITFISNGVEVSHFDPSNTGRIVREEYGLTGKYVVIYAGAMGSANDLDTVLSAANRLASHSDIHLFLVGDGKERSRLEARLRNESISNVSFAGPQPKNRMGDFLAASDACLAILKDIPMFRMTYPNKVFDYMAAGRPVLLAIDGVIREVVEAAGAGVFVPPNDPAALAKAISGLYRDRDGGTRMGLMGREYVQRHFGRATQSDMLETVLGSLVYSSAPKTSS